MDGAVRPERLSLPQWLCRALPPIVSYRLGRKLQRPGLAGEQFVTRTSTGQLFSYKTGDVLADQVRMCGYWDWRVLAIAKALCRPGDTIIEIGANTGTETVGLAHIVGPRGRVVAFEPIPQIAEALRHNVRINNFKNVDVFEIALTDRDHKVRMHQPPSERNSGQGYVTHNVKDPGIDVLAVALDSMAASIGCSPFILIDVEGHEVAVLRGARGYLRRHRPVIVVEAVSEQLVRAGSSLSELADELTTSGYEVLRINRISVTPIVQEQLGPSCHQNWLCLPREQSGKRRGVNAMLPVRALTPGAFKGR